MTTHSSVTSSDDSGFTLVSYGKKTRAANTTHSTSTSNTVKEGQGGEGNMNMVKTWKFKDFQQTIFPIIQNIAKNPGTSEHPFVQRWCNAMKGSKKIMAVSTYCTVAKSFNLKDLQDYRRFLLTAPNIEDYKALNEGDSKSNGFYYSIHHDSNT